MTSHTTPSVFTQQNKAELDADFGQQLPAFSSSDPGKKGRDAQQFSQRIEFLLELSF